MAVQQGDLIGLLEHQRDCSGEEGQEGAGGEVALAMGGVWGWEWRLTHLGSFSVPGWSWGVSEDMDSFDPSSAIAPGGVRQGSLPQPLSSPDLSRPGSSSSS